MAATEATERPPTKRQLEVLAFIEGYISREGYSPSFEDIATALGVSQAAVGGLLVRLQQHGLIARQRFQPRTIVVLNSANARQ